MTLNWQAYRDGDRWIIGAREWQGTAVSLTYGISEAYSRAEVQNDLAWAKANPEAATARKRAYDTYDRFESACDAGRFGPAWD